MTNYQTGHDAEISASEYLENLGYKIIELNWKTKYCEIDIIAIKDEIVHLVEVKSRKSISQGTGFDYITPKKLRQMKFSAEFWASKHNWTGDYYLSAISIDNDQIQFIDNLT